MHEYLSEYARIMRAGASNNQAVLKRKTIKLTKEEQAKANNLAAREAIFARVERTIERACVKALHGDEGV